MDRYDATDQHLVFEGISDGIDNKFGFESIFYGMGFLSFIITVALFFDLFFTSITSPILYSTFAPVRRRRRRSIKDPPKSDAEDLMKIPGIIQNYKPPILPTSHKFQNIWNSSRLDADFWASILITAAIYWLSVEFGNYFDDVDTETEDVDTFNHNLQYASVVF